MRTKKVKEKESGPKNQGLWVYMRGEGKNEKCDTRGIGRRREGE